jgi:hypothetical protein
LPALAAKLRTQFDVPKGPENFGAVAHRPAVKGKTVEFDCGEFLEFVLTRAEIAEDTV